MQFSYKRKRVENRKNGEPDDRPRRCRKRTKKRSEEKEKLGRKGGACLRSSCVAECRDFALRDWTERSLRSASPKQRACICLARKGRIFYASSRSSYSPIPFSSLPFRPRFARLLFAAVETSLTCFPPPRFRFGDSFLVVLAASISSCFSLSLSLSSSSSSGQNFASSSLLHA